MYKVKLVRMAKRARERRQSLEDISALKKKGPSFSELTDFSWVYSVPLYIQTAEWPIPHVPYTKLIKVTYQILHSR